MDSLVSFGIAWSYAIGFLLLGFTLILLEIFLIPGLNVFGLFGLLAVATGVYIAYLKLGLLEALIMAAIGVLFTLLLLRKVLKSRRWQDLVLSRSTSKSEGFDSARKDQGSLLGLVGETVTTLHPTGRVRFDDEFVDVVSEGGFVNKGDLVKVIKVNGHKVVVQPCGSQRN